MLVQNRIFTADAEDAEKAFFCLAGDTAKQKGFRPFNASLIIGAIAIKRLRSSSRRDGVFDPIAVSVLRSRRGVYEVFLRLDPTPVVHRFQC
jgi:hypothetical protein